MIFCLHAAFNVVKRLSQSAIPLANFPQQTQQISCFPTINEHQFTLNTAFLKPFHFLYAVIHIIFTQFSFVKTKNRSKSAAVKAFS